MMKNDHVDFRLPSLPEDPFDLEQFIIRQERVLPIKEDNEARIEWYDPATRAQTPLSVVYLHGFTASQGEGAPLHRHFARRYGCNLFLSRLAGHGLRDHVMMDFTLDKLFESVSLAFAIGRAIGQKVILMGTSTGASLALLLAARMSDIHSLITYSPLLRIYDNKARWLSIPVVNDLASTLFQFKTIRNYAQNEQEARYWYHQYPARSLKTLHLLLRRYLKPSLFRQVRHPFFMGYYYKDEQHQDETVSVPAMLAMYKQLGTPLQKKRKLSFPEAGSHVICTPLTSQSYDAVEKETFLFAEQILGLEPNL